MQSHDSPLLTLPISKVEIYQHQHQRQHGELHIISGDCHIIAKPYHCCVVETSENAIDTHHLVIRENLNLVVRIPIAVQREAEQLTVLINKFLAEGASHD